MEQKKEMMRTVNTKVGILIAWKQKIGIYFTVQLFIERSYGYVWDQTS